MWYKSATKTVLIIMTLALIAGFLLGKVEAKDFVMQVGVVFAFYFGQKSMTPDQPVA